MATFKPGTTALGHRWLLTGADGGDLGTSKFRYEGTAGRTFGRLARVTGLAAGNDLKAEVNDASGETVALVRANNDDQPTVDVQAPDGSPIGRMSRDSREAGELRFEAGPGNTVIGRVALDDGDGPWQVVDAAGVTVAQLSAGDQVKRVQLSTLDVLGVETGSQSAREFQATMHFGVRDSPTYATQRTSEQPLPEPLRSFVGLLPVLSAYSY